MKQYIFLFAILVQVLCSVHTASAQDDSTSTQQEEETTKFVFNASPALGLTIQNISKSDEETLNAQWLASVRSRLLWEGPTLGLSGSLYLQFGQFVEPDYAPTKTQDNLIVSLTPSLAILPEAGIRLFLETTGETQMAEGFVDTAKTGFLDPLFVYQSLFVGQKILSVSDDNTSELSFTYGAGYALQQTLANEFALQSNRVKISETNPLSSVQDVVTVESGISAIVDFNARKQLNETMSITASIKTVMLGKEAMFQDVANSRVSALALMSMQLGIFTLDYNMRIVYDNNYSKRRQLDQSLVLGLRYNI